MANYDYKKGKERIESILDNDLEVIEKANCLKMMLLHFLMVIIVGLRAFLLIFGTLPIYLQKKIKRKFQRLFAVLPLKLLKS